MKKNFFLLILFSCIIISAMEEDHEDQFSEQWKVLKSIEYGDSIKSIDFNAKDKQLLVCDYKGQAALWNLDDQKVILKHAAGWKPSFSTDNKYIITAPDYDKVALSDTHGKEIMKIKTNSYNEGVKFNEQGNKILIAARKKIALWDIEKNKKIAKWQKNSVLRIAKFFPHNEQLIFIGYLYDYFKIWDRRSKKLIQYDGFGGLRKVDIHPEGTYLACVRDFNAAALIYDLRKQDHTRLPILGDDARFAKFNSTGSHVLAQYPCSEVVPLWKTCDISQYLDDQAPRPNITLKKRNLYSGKFHPKDENRVIAYSRKENYCPENSISIWDINGKELAMLPHEERLSRAKFDPTGEHIISRDVDNIIRLWKKVSGKK